MKKVLIITGILGLVGLGIGLYLHKNKNKLTDKDFDALIGLSKNKGYDVFEDLSNREMDIIKDNYLKFFNIKSNNDLMNILRKGESNMTSPEKLRLKEYLNRILKGLTKL